MVAVLFVFLGNLRAGLIVASAIPLSMLCAFIGMSHWGISASLLSSALSTLASSSTDPS